MSSGAPETRKRILEETRRLMEAQRGSEVRLEDIARAAGVSRQAVYMHFGSRTNLLVETARYLDALLGLDERIRPVREAANSLLGLEANINFWGHYLPDIYGLAKALLNARETDEAAAAAWDDRMHALYEGCLICVECLARDGLLAHEWSVSAATDFFLACLSVPTWENLTQERGWTTEQYVERMTLAIKRALVRVDGLSEK